MPGPFSGAFVRRVIDHSGKDVPEHAHDWPLLSLFVMGGCLTRAEPGEAFVSGPSAVLYRAGAKHKNTVGDFGFEQIEIEFDPAWLGDALPTAPVSRWIGGRIGGAARAFARLCTEEIDEAALRAGLRQFLEGASRAPPRRSPGWVEEVSRRLRENPSLTARDLSPVAQRHPAWLGTAYLRATGEGLAVAAARFRVESAARLLRETDLAPAQVAAEVGFCDQSHMSRTFRNLFGRLPSAVRADRDRFRRLT
ncbi:MAG TPA: AraC family transcriptional regulator [Caulobacteraceae bacterium]|jgi:AraC-like DNA-binding protein